MTGEEWQTAQLLYAKPPTVDVHVQLDLDLAHWLEALGKDYQARLNAALRYTMRNGF